MKKYTSLEHSIRKVHSNPQYKKKNLNEDFEYEMARNELKTAIDAAKRLLSNLEGEGEIEAWVQSKITKASDYLDTVADYMDNRDNKKLKEETEEILEAIGIVGSQFKGNDFTQTEGKKEEKEDGSVPNQGNAATVGSWPAAANTESGGKKKLKEDEDSNIDKVNKIANDLKNMTKKSSEVKLPNINDGGPDMFKPGAKSVVKEESSGTKDRREIEYVGRPDSADSPKSVKSKLGRQGQYKTKIIDEALTETVKRVVAAKKKQMEPITVTGEPATKIDKEPKLSKTIDEASALDYVKKNKFTTGMGALSGVMDYQTRREKGQSVLKSLGGAAASTLGGVVGGVAGGLAGGVGALGGSMAGSYAANKLYNKATGIKDDDDDDDDDKDDQSDWTPEMKANPIRTKLRSALGIEEPSQNKNASQADLKKDALAAKNTSLANQYGASISDRLSGAKRAKLGNSAVTPSNGAPQPVTKTTVEPAVTPTSNGASISDRLAGAKKAKLSNSEKLDTIDVTADKQEVKPSSTKSITTPPVVQPPVVQPPSSVDTKKNVPDDKSAGPQTPPPIVKPPDVKSGTPTPAPAPKPIVKPVVKPTPVKTTASIPQKDIHVKSRAMFQAAQDTKDDSPSSFFAADAQRMKELGKKAPSDFSQDEKESGGKKKKVNESILIQSFLNLYKNK